MMRFSRLGLIALIITLFGVILSGTPGVQAQEEKKIIAKWSVDNFPALEDRYPEFLVWPYWFPLSSPGSATFIEYSDGTALLEGLVDIRSNNPNQTLPEGVSEGEAVIRMEFQGRTTNLQPYPGNYTCAEEQNLRYYISAEGTIGPLPIHIKRRAGQFGVGAHPRYTCDQEGSWFWADWGTNKVDIAFLLIPIHDAQLGNRVWKDLNLNGLQDEGEPGIDGIEVRLLDDGKNVLATTTTANDGLYIFENLPAGDYQVEFESMDSMPFTQQDAGNDLQDSDVGENGRTELISLGQSESNLSIDAGLIDPPTPTPTATDTPMPTDTPTPLPTATHVPGAIGNRTWLDENRNGLQDPGEPNVSGIIINLLSKDSEEPLATTTSDENGNYNFADLDPKVSYRVQFVIPDGVELAFTTQNQGTDEEDSDAELTDGITADFVTIEAGESNYSVDAGFYSTAPTATPTDTPTNTLTPTPTPTATHVPARIGDFVWLDTNENGVQDEDEAGVEGIIIELLPKDGDIPLALTATDANGFYEFIGLSPKESYRIRFRLPAFSMLAFSPIDQGDDALDSDADPATGLTDFIVVDPGEDNPTIDAGVFEPAPTATPTPLVPPTATPLPASINGRVWKDDNGNGLDDDNEPGVGGIEVALISKFDDMIMDSTTTDSDGTYTFTNLDPSTSYRVWFNLPSGGGSIFADSSRGDDESIDSDVDPTTGITKEFIELTPGQSSEVDAGIRNTVASIGDFVWLDENQNDIQDPDEPGIADAQVSLWTDTTGDGQPDEVLARAITDENGNYRFIGLNPKIVYFVKFETPLKPNASIFPAKPGSDSPLPLDPELDSDFDPFTGITGPITLEAGEDRSDIDGGFIAIDDQANEATPTPDGEPEATATPEDEPEPTATPMDEPEPTATAEDEPEPTATPVDEPEPTATPVDEPEPTATAEDEPLATATPEDEPEPTATLEPTATPEPEPTFTPTPAAGPEGPVIMVSTDTIGEGEEVVVTLEGFNLAALGTATIEVVYDPAVLTLVSCDKDPNGLFDLVQCNRDFGPDRVRFNITSLTGVSGDVTIAELTFQATGQNGDRSDINVLLPTVANSAGAPLTFSVVDGWVIISAVRMGDVNCDGVRNAVDAMMSMQYDIGLREASPTCTQPQRSKAILLLADCDVSDDGQCNAVDALLTLQCDVGLANATCPAIIR